VAIRARAFAKINLDLHIAGLLPGGYHELRTTFQSIALHDILTFAPRRGPMAMSTDDPHCPSQNNIVEQAAAALWRSAGRRGSPPGVAVRIEKRIPIEAGLGGGSADAAAALRALTRLWRIRLTAEQLREVAGSLGADVPFFLVGGTARGAGRGDELTRLADARQRWVVIVVPAFGVSTREAYQWYDEARAGRPSRGRLRNDLQPPVVARHPEIGHLINALEKAGALHAGMSGSGSAVFGLFASLAAAESAAADHVGSARRVMVTRTLPRATFQRLSRPILARK
jgi:4-diphosphocytidyl-2-C-methyl-D-erythritol kinase